MTLDKIKDGFDITWTTNNTKETLKDCFDLKIGDWNWYGGPERDLQRWPIEKLHLKGAEPYIIKKTSNNAVGERYWLNSKGAFIFVDDRVPLWVDQNEEQQGKVCFIAKAINPYINRKRVSRFILLQNLVFLNIKVTLNFQVFLKYHVGVQDNPKQSHIYAVNKFITLPKGNEIRLIKAILVYQKPISLSYIVVVNLIK